MDRRQAQGISATIDCPIPWCTGHTGDHGGYGDEPSAWLHSSADIPLTRGPVLLCRSRTGAGRERWDLSVRDADFLTGDSPAALATQLRALAIELEAVSTR